jgi:predicted phage replisome organizer
VADVKWIKLKVGMFDGMSFKKIKKAKIGGESYRDKLTAVWFELMDFAAQCNHDGAFIDSREIPFYELSDIAMMIDRETDELELCMAFFINEGMVSIEDDIYMLSAWSAYQNTDRLAELREYNRLAKQKQRAKQKALPDVKDKSMTSQSSQDTDIDIDIEEDKDKEEEKKKKKSKKEEALDLLDSLLSESYLSNDVKAKMLEWVSYKAEIKDFYTETGLKVLLRKVYDRCRTYGDTAVIEVIDDSISSLYKGIVFDRIKTASKVTPKPQKKAEEPEFLKKWSV